MKRLILLIASLAALVVLVSAADKRKAPDFTLKTADGKTVTLSELKGKVVIVNFWATWCGPCRKEIPDFLDVYSTHKSKGLEIVGISVDQNGWEAVTPFVKSNNITYPVVLGDQAEARKWGRIQFIPTTFIVDKQGYIVDSHTGVLTKEALLKKLSSLL